MSTGGYRSAFWALVGGIAGQRLAGAGRQGRTQEAPIQATQYDPVAESRSRKAESGAARWSLIGTLVGGLVGGGFGFATATFTTIRGEEQAREQFEAARDQNREEFLRAQRLDTYNAGVTDSQVFMADLSRWVGVNTRLEGSSSDSAELIDSANTVEESYRNAFSSIWGIRLIAPPTVDEVNQLIGEVVDCGYRKFIDGFQPEDEAELIGAGERVTYLVSRFSEHTAIEFRPEADAPQAIQATGSRECDTAG